MTQEQEKTALFAEHIDTSIIARFPPGFFQKGLVFMREHHKSFKMQLTAKRLFLRNAKGQIITWAYYEKTNSD